jgi:nicotinamide-nucleotide amidase
MGVELVENKEWTDKLYEMFKGRNITPNNFKQAYMPKGSIMLYNDNGTAPGVIIENKEKSKAIILLPGPPSEMVPMFDKSVMPYMMKKTESHFIQILYDNGLWRKRTEHELIDIIDKQINPTIATYVKPNGILLRVTANAEDKESADLIIDKYEKIIYSRLGDGIFANEDISIAKVVLNMLKERNLKFAAAESCTGGMISTMMTENPGASDVFYGGLVTYSNDAKIKILGVKKEIIEKYGAVSEETAVEMVKGLAKLSASDVAVSVTGIAGPGGGSEEKPVGLTYISVYYKGEITTKQVNYAFRRKMHQLRVACEAYNMIRNKILEDK